MIINISIFIWFVFVVTIVSILLWQLKNKKYQTLMFQNYIAVGIPYVTIKVQGQLFNFIVDSGAAVSVITTEALSMLCYEPSLRKIEVSAITADTIPHDMVTIPFVVNGHEIKEDFIVYPSDDLANFKAMHNLTAHGILGNEFFEKTRCKIDYNKHLITMY